MEESQELITISVGELNDLLQQHSLMKEEITNLKDSLDKCEQKWNKIVKNTLRENVALKDQNRALKERIKTIEMQNNTTFSNS